MDEENIFVVGYNGWVKLFMMDNTVNYCNGNHVYYDGGILLQATSASVTRTANFPTVNSYYLPFLDETGTARSPKLLGTGTYQFSGELSFEITGNAISSLFNEIMFKRGSWFAVTMFDGNKRCGITNCVWSNFSITCSPGGLVTASISYQSNNGYQSNLLVGDATKAFSYDSSDLLIPYWRCGHDEFLDFSITFSRNVSPVFLNNSLVVPSYLRPGLIEVSLQASSLAYKTNWKNDNGIIDVHIGSSHGIKINYPVLQSVQYNMSSMTDAGARTYTWNSIGSSMSSKIFTIY